MSTLNRRHLVALAAALATMTPGLALAQAKIKVAGIYTVPFEQQWAGRLHTALKAAEADDPTKTLTLLQVSGF